MVAILELGVLSSSTFKLYVKNEGECFIRGFETLRNMKVHRRRRSAFNNLIVLRCLEPLMTHEAQVFDITSCLFLPNVSVMR